MSVLIKESDLPQELTAEAAVEAAYAGELAEAASKLQRGLPTLIECDKDMGPFLYLNIRNRLRAVNPPLRCLYLDGRPRQEEPQGAMPMGMIGTMISQLREAVRGAVERRVVVLPHLDLLTTSQGGLTAEAREVIPLLYENPELVWLGFKDPSFPLPRVIENLFPHRISLMGIPRARLRCLITRRESRKFGREFNPWGLYKYVSGINAARLRKLLSTLEGEDYPTNPQQAYRQLRQATLGGTLEVPNIALEADIGGYARVKERLRNEVLHLLARKEQLTSEEQIKGIEELIPKGMIFWGPPGTGKTLFAKALASEIGAAVTIVSGPELKSKWVGESLPWDEEVFVVLNGMSRKMPIGELVDNHRDCDDVRTWTVRDDGTALLSPVTGFIRHQGPDYVDVLITETGRRVRVTGGHSLFVNQEGKLGEILAEQVEPGVTRIAVPLRLEAPQTVLSLDLLQLLSGREDVRVSGYDDQLADAVGLLGEDCASTITGVAVRRLTHKQRPPLSISAFESLAAACDRDIDSTSLSLYCWHRNKTLPAHVPLTPELGEFFGLWVADGCYAETGVRLASNTEQVDRIHALCERLFGHVTRYKKTCSPRSVDLIINHTLLRHVMKDGLGMQDGSDRKRVPPFIFLAPKPVVAGFLRGYISGDGTFSRKYIEATTINQGLADDVMTLLQYFGIAARCRLKREAHGAPAYRVRFLWSVFLRRFADEIGFLDDRRNHALRAYLDGMTFKRDKQTPTGHITNDVLWDRVVEKRREPYARPHVYDLSVAGTERFVAGFGNVLVHNSEDNLRQIFHKARQSAPSIIVFDELDSFATTRGTYTGSGVEHSMVNQLLTEMDGFHKDEMVFVVGTTNFVESLDPALLRPGRFEFHLHIPYPDDDARREIIKIYDRKMALKMTEETIEHTVRRTDWMVPGAASGTYFSGDHLNALCRSIARFRLRDGRQDDTTPEDVERALTEWIEKTKLTPLEERVTATHEAGHAVCALMTPGARPIQRIAIADDVVGALGYVRTKRPDHKYYYTLSQMRADIIVCYGGVEAEKELLGEPSMGLESDLDAATHLARLIVESMGQGNNETGVGRYRVRTQDGGEIRNPDLSDTKRQAMDQRIDAILHECQQIAAATVKANRPLIETLRDLLIEKKVIEASTLKTIVPDVKPAANLPQEKEEKRPSRKSKSE